MEAVEASAYDLKDHPDFKFRPAQTVIRVIDTQVGTLIYAQVKTRERIHVQKDCNTLTDNELLSF